MKTDYRIGVDLGGTKIEAVVLDDSGKVIWKQRVPTPQNDYQGILHSIEQLVLAAEKEAKVSASVGVATPGALSPASGTIKNSNSVCLNGKSLDQDLQALLSREVRFANDADCMTLSEAVDGAAAGAKSVFGVIIGTGTGGGIVIDGRLLQGPNAIAGEWGHNPLPWPRADELPGPPCYCGKRGCIETFLSGPGLSRDHARYCDEDRTAQEISDEAEGNGIASRSTISRYVDRMARSLASVINVIDPEVIVLAGGLSNIALLYDAVPYKWGQYVFSDRVDTRLVQAKYGDASGVRGAAWL